MKVPLSRPDIGQAEIHAVVEVLQSGTLSIGPNVEELERLCAQCAGVRFAVAVNSGTSALMLIMKFLNPRKGDLWITTPFSFVTSSNIALYERAIPIFSDIDPITLNMDPQALSETINQIIKGQHTIGDGRVHYQSNRLKGIIGVDIFGQPMDWDAVIALCNKHRLEIVEDSCESIGATYKGKPCGSFGIAGAFAFYPNKQITTGEGGVVVTDHYDLFQMARSLRNQGRGIDEQWLNHVELGYNFRMDELSASLGVQQMNRIDQLLNQRAAVANQYNQLFRDSSYIQTPVIGAFTTKMSWFVYVILLDPHIPRDRLLSFLQKKGVGCREYFRPIHLQPLYQKMFGYRPGTFPVTESIAARTIALPFHSQLTSEEQEYVVDCVQQGVEML